MFAINLCAALYLGATVGVTAVKQVEKVGLDLHSPSISNDEFQEETTIRILHHFPSLKWMLQLTLAFLSFPS